MATGGVDPGFRPTSGGSADSDAAPFAQYPKSNAYALRFHFPSAAKRGLYTDEETVVLVDSDEKCQKLDSLKDIFRITGAKVDQQNRVIILTHIGNVKNYKGKWDKWIKDVKDTLKREIGTAEYKLVYTGPGADEVKRQVDDHFSSTDLSTTQSNDNQSLLLVSADRRNLDAAERFVEEKRLCSAAAGEFVTSTKLRVSAFKADITKLNVDGIVSAVDENLSFSGGVSRAISAAAGDELVQAAKQYVKDNGPVSVTKVVETTGGKLKKKVLHAVGPRWDDNEDKDLCEQQLTDTVYNCLVKASDLGITTLGIPAISSGTFQVPYAISAYCYQRAVKKFDQKEGQTRLQHIVFVDIKESVIQRLRQSFGELQMRGPQGNTGKELRVALIGQVGTGKSALGNSILGNPRAFKSMQSFKAITEEIRRGATFLPDHDLELQVVDTPGLFDPKDTQKERIKQIEKEIVKSMSLLLPGPHIILVVCKTGRFTPTEADIYKQVQRIFPGSTNYTIAVFTHTENDTVIEQLWEDPDPELEDVKEHINDCGNRWAAIDNFASESDLKKQVDKLIKKMCDLYEANGKSFYSSKILSSCLQLMMSDENSGKTLEEMKLEVLAGNDKQLEMVMKNPEFKAEMKKVRRWCTIL